jgi:hypothetical protein
MELGADTVGPVFAIIGLGYLLAGRRSLDLATLADLAILLTSPALMFSVLSGTEVVAKTWAALAGGTVFVAAGCALLAFGTLRTGGAGRDSAAAARDHVTSPRTDPPADWINASLASQSLPASTSSRLSAEGSTARHFWK